MRVLWITNTPIAKHREMLGVSFSQSGGWMEATYSALKNAPGFTFGVATIYLGIDLQKANDLQHTFFLVPSDKVITEYDPESKKNQALWQKVINEFQPDIIQLWGTEFVHGLCALRVARGIPSVAYIQGMMSQIANHALGELSFKDRLASTTISDLVKKKTYKKELSTYQHRAENERIILALVNGVIVENDWCAENCRIISNNIHVFKSLLPINTMFTKHNWSLDQMKPYTIFTTAGPTPIKGHHMLLKALNLVVKRFPKTQLLIPGESYYFEHSFARSLKRRSYAKHLLSLCKKYQLDSHVHFLGKLTPDQMAENMQKCNVFAMPSAIENHSSTLIEAMMVGAPSVSSNVGGVAEYVTHGENGFLYRYDEPEMLAAYIIRIFSDTQLAKTLSNAAQDSMKHRVSDFDLNKDYNHIYKQLISDVK